MQTKIHLLSFVVALLLCQSAHADEAGIFGSLAQESTITIDDFYWFRWRELTESDDDIQKLRDAVSTAARSYCAFASKYLTDHSRSYFLDSGKANTVAANWDGSIKELYESLGNDYQVHTLGPMFAPFDGGHSEATIQARVSGLAGIADSLFRHCGKYLSDK